MEIKKFTRLSMLLALSVVLALLESLIPFFDGSIVGLKLGLANIVILYVLYTYTLKDAFFLSITRVLLIGLLRTGVFSIPFFFSLSGAIWSLSAMYIGKKTKLFSMIGVSIIGSLFHSLGQILIAIILLNNIYISYSIPLLFFVAIPTGIFTGILSKELTKYLEKRL